VLAGEADLAYEMSFEVLPEVKLADLASFKLERLVAEVDDAAVDKALKSLAESNRTFVTEEGRSAGEGDRLLIDFSGTVDGAPFEGGKGEDVDLIIGSASFIPGFEDGLKGAAKGERREVKVTFPAEYPVAALAGKEGLFDVTVKDVQKPVTPEIDDEFAKGLGTDGLENLKGRIAAQLRSEYAAAARMKLKRELLDALEKAHDFELPASLVEREIEVSWRRFEEGLKRAGRTLADVGKTEEEARAEHRRNAERRVRLGLVVGEIGDRNGLEVTQDELRRALIEQARRFPGQEKHVYEYFEKTPGALQELKAPVFEDKVVDFILEAAKPTERKVSREEFARQIEEAREA
jgi:trigger factor